MTQCFLGGKNRAVSIKPVIYHLETPAMASPDYETSYFIKWVTLQLPETARKNLWAGKYVSFCYESCASVVCVELLCDF